MLANIGGSSLCAVDVAGSFGRDLSAQGEAAMVAFAVEWLTKLFGSDVGAGGEEIQRDALERRAVCARRDVGGGAGRAGIAQNSDGAGGNLFLAGEAAHETLWGTVDGAWESGERAADAALRKLGAVRDAAPDQPERRVEEAQMRTQ